MRLKLLAIFSAILLLGSCTKSNIHKIDLEKYFNEFQVEGCFIFYDLKSDQYQIYNHSRAKTRYYPASTFKILNTLAALETGVAKDEDFFLKWDGTKRVVVSHNQDHTLMQAFQNSTVWFYQEIARRIGKERMQEIVNKAQYGNRDIGLEVDKFWLNGPLKITPLEQTEFLKKLHLEQLPFSNHAIELTKKIMVREETQHYVLRAKTGTTSYDGKQLCWYIGYIETDENTYFFVLNIEGDKSKNFLDGKATKAKVPLAKKILQEKFGLL